MNKTTKCPSCGCKYRVPEEFEGRKISCKKCGALFQLVLPDESNQNSTGEVAQSLESDVEEISQDDSYLHIKSLKRFYIKRLCRAAALFPKVIEKLQKLFVSRRTIPF